MFRMVKSCEKIGSFKSVVEYFCLYQWIFTNRNSRLLQNQMNDIDRQVNKMNITAHRRMMID
jgi:hypothetical protein